jgi:MoaA/NifB/PqqE/SkfB family radical SAM enzyme
MLFEPYNLNVSYDITTYCNAKCPQCHRTNKNGLARNESVPLVHVPKEKIFKTFTPDLLSRINYLALVPTWGDTMMHPDIYEIIEYFLEVNKERQDFSVSIDTNGSMRDEDFWFKFGCLQRKTHGPRLHVKWDIDGHNQEIHSHYRRNTNLDKILRNMEAFSQTLARTTSQTILFKHNQPYMKEIKEVATKAGSTQHTFVMSERFYNKSSNGNNYYEFIDEAGATQILEKADESKLKNTFIAHMSDEEDYEEYKKRVVCRWALINKININFDGQVWPCCYFGYSDIGSDDISHQEQFYKADLIKEYNKNRLENNIYYNTIEDMLKNKWWTEYLPKSIEEDPVPQCTRNCSSYDPNSRVQLRTVDV